MAHDKPTSGSRWEPGADDETAPIAGPAPQRGWRDRMASARGRVRGTRGVAVLVAAAALLVGGLGGFAVAHVVDDESGGGLHDAPGQGPFGGEHGDRHGGPGQGFGPGDGGRPGDSGTDGDGD